jgi:hypothetical protein
MNNCKPANESGELWPPAEGFKAGVPGFRNDSEQQEQKRRPEERTLPSCDVCGSFYVVRMADGTLECQTCADSEGLKPT